MCCSDVIVEKGKDRRTENARMTSQGARTLVRYKSLPTRESLRVRSPERTQHVYRDRPQKLGLREKNRPSRPSIRTIVTGSFHRSSSIRTVTGPPPSRWLWGRRKRESRESWWICVNKGALAENDGQHVRPLEMKKLCGTIQLR
jgi:hypothetical protein